MGCFPARTAAKLAACIVLLAFIQIGIGVLIAHFIQYCMPCAGLFDHTQSAVVILCQFEKNFGQPIRGNRIAVKLGTLVAVSIDYFNTRVVGITA